MKEKELESRSVRAIGEKVFPGCVIGIVKAGQRTVLPFGHMSYDEGAKKVSEDTIYDIASITKSIPTASLALMLEHEGKLRLSDSVRKYLPELQNDYRATIENLLTYTVHGVRMSTLKDKKPAEIRQYIFEHGFGAPPGERSYNNLTAFLLGEILERLSGDSLENLARKHFFKPLGMINTSFFPPDKNRCAPTEIDDGGVVQGIVHDESARVFARSRQAVGHAGLFSTAPDLLNFLEALLKGKHPSIVKGAQKGLGWQRADQMHMGKKAALPMFGKTGFTGTSVFVDMDGGIGFVILSNRTYPKRPGDFTAIRAFRSDIADIILH